MLLGKIKCAANRVGLWGWLQLFLFCEGLAFCLSFYCSFSFVVSSFRVAGNGFGLCVRAGFGAQSFNLLLKFIRSTNLQVCTSFRLTHNQCQLPACFLNFNVNILGGFDRSLSSKYSFISSIFNPWAVADSVNSEI